MFYSYGVVIWERRARRKRPSIMAREFKRALLRTVRTVRIPDSDSRSILSRPPPGHHRRLAERGHRTNDSHFKFFWEGFVCLLVC